MGSHAKRGNQGRCVSAQNTERPGLHSHAEREKYRQRQQDCRMYPGNSPALCNTSSAFVHLNVRSMLWLRFLLSMILH